jgi:RecA/RadA recombinase
MLLIFFIEVYGEFRTGKTNIAHTCNIYKYL